MPILGFAAVALALGILLWFAGVYLPVDRKGRRSPDRRHRDRAIPVPIPVDRSGTPRPREEANPPTVGRSALGRR